MDVVFDQLFYAILITENNGIQRKLAKLSNVKKSTREELYIRLELAKNYLEDNFTTDVNLDELAKFCSLSKYYMIRSFKKIHGKSPYAYLLEKRLQKASALLLKKAYSLERIASEINYSDVRNLRRDLTS